MGQQNGIGAAVRQMEHGAELMRHPVVQAESRRVKGHTGEAGSRVDLFSGFVIIGVGIGTAEIAAAKFYRAFGKSGGEIIAADTDKRFNGVGQNIHPGIGGNGFRHRFHEYRVENGLIGEELFIV